MLKKDLIKLLNDLKSAYECCRCPNLFVVIQDLEKQLSNLP